VIAIHLEPALDEIAQAQQARPDWKLRIEGHTGNIGGDAYNQNLSSSRAEAIKMALTSGHNIRAGRRTTQGFDDTRPTALNRRVELVNWNRTKFSRRIEMRKVILSASICLLAGVILSAAGKVQPLNVKTGLWQVTMTTTMSGLPPIPPEMQARLEQMPPEQRAKMEEMIKSRFGGAPHNSSYKKCVTKEELENNAFNKPDEKCNWTVVNSTGSDMEVKGTSCAAGKSEGMQTDVDLKLHVVDSENVQATMQFTATGNGHTMNGNGTYTGKWLGASCPEGTN
jgi:hypothetical protein